MPEKHIPKAVLNGLREICIEEGIERLILFGSRARGTHSERSDIDIAAKFHSARQLDNFKEKIDDLKRIPSLLIIDVINLNSDMLSPALIEDIEKDGVIIYEKI